MRDWTEIDTTRKHYEPQLYLRGFTIPAKSRQEQIYAFEKQQPDRGIWSTSIKNVSVSTDAYTVENDDHFKQRECVYARLLETIIRHVKTHGDCRLEDVNGWEYALKWFSDFLLTSLLRSSGRLAPDNPLMQAWYAESRETMREFWEGQDPDFMKRLSDELDSLGWDVPTFQKWADEQAGRDDIRRWIPLTIDPLGRTSSFDETRELLNNGNWTFHRANKNRKFITGDNPVIARSGPEPEHRNFVVWYMPLSANVLAVVTSADAAGRLGGPFVNGLYEDERMVELQNLCMFENAFRFVYGSSEFELKRAIRWHETGLSPLRDELPAEVH